MFKKIIHFIEYHNAVSIIFVVIFFGGGMVFAASPEARDSVYSSTETVVSVDNSYIVNADLDNYNFYLKIGSVTEDSKNYYAAYTYWTLTIEDGVWQRKEISKTLTVSKEALGGRDLGLYVAEELGENIKSELAYLKSVQKLERERGESQKVIAIEYAGLIGKLLDPKTEVVEGYEPVVPEPPAKIAEALNPAVSADAAPYYEPENESDSVVTTPQTEPAEEPAPVVVPQPPEVLTEEEPPLSPQEPEPEVIAPPETAPTSTPLQPEPIAEPVPEVAPTSTPPQPEPAVEPEPEPIVEATSTPEAAP